MTASTQAPPLVEASAAPADLSQEIIALLDKRANDRVTCRRISGDNYRCNWWAPADGTAYDNPGMSGLVVTTHRVRQSRFITAIRTPQGLVLSESRERRRL
jgi:hypothetical protein